jgi:FKBP-type peptidyl-prolyl cis-trans isomerase SlpA
MSVFDTSEGKEPLEFTLGQGKLIPGFEKWNRYEIKREKTITISQEDAYGEAPKI